VYIDGVSKGSLNLYAPVAQASSMMFSGLSASKHTVTIKVTGKSVLSGGYYVMVDGFRVGNLITQDTSPYVRYGDWVGRESSNAAGGAYRLATTSSSSASLTFIGTRVAWITATAPSAGKAQVFIDGISRGVVDLYAERRTWGVRKSYSGLSSGSHIIAVRVLGTRNAESSKSNVVVDGFTVTSP
jgi:bacillopeptidase F